MAKIKKTKYVILGLLEDHPLTGYEIMGIIKESTNYFWKESDASIYPTLKLLTEEELVTSETTYTGKRAREVFTITNEGKKEFAEWFKKTPEPDARRQEFLLKLFFTNDKNAEEMKLHIENRLKALKALLKSYKDIEKALKEEHPNKFFWMATLKHGIINTEGEISLLQKQLQEMKK